MNELFRAAYGSHLYGTATPTSDFDYKVVYLPPFEDVLLGRKLSTFKTRFAADGSPVAQDAKMPDGGTETEFIPFQTFCTDYLNGQTYALELVQAHGHRVGAPSWMVDLLTRFTTANVSSMAGFAMKQTFDYVHRGQRLAAAERVLEVLTYWSGQLDDYDAMEPGSYTKKRLDTVMPDGRKVLDAVLADTGLEEGSTVNNGRTMRTLKLNGREYLETTELQHLKTAVGKLVDSYGHRSKDAKENEVDLKSLMHAVRVYEQCVELLTTGRMTFPRFNVQYLLNVKQGRTDLEEVRARLLELEAQVAELQASSTLLPAKTPALQAEFDQWLFTQLVQHYKLLGVRYV